MTQTWMLQLPTFRFLWTLLSVNYYSVGVNLGFMLSWCINEIVTVLWHIYGIFQMDVKYYFMGLMISRGILFFSFLFWYRRKDLWANSKNACNLRNGQRRLAAWLLNLMVEWVEFHILREMIHVILLDLQTPKVAFGLKFFGIGDYLIKCNVSQYCCLMSSDWPQKEVSDELLFWKMLEMIILPQIYIVRKLKIMNSCSGYKSRIVWTDWCYQWFP